MDRQNRLWILVSLLVLLWAGLAPAAELSAQREAALVEDVLSIYRPQQATGTDVGDFRKCGTPIMAELFGLWDRLSPESRALLKPYVELRPQLDLFYDTPEGHFRIHYSITGDDAVDLSHGMDGDIPVYVKTCAGIIEHIWHQQIDVMGYRKPPSDGFYNEGETDAYDVYLVELGYKYLGLTQPDEPITGNPPLATSFMKLDNNYLGYYGYEPDEWDEMMSVTAAHEFFHAVQFGIDLSEYFEDNSDGSADIWWHEMSATWMEDVLYDEVNDYHAYLPAFFRHPNWSLVTNGGNGDKALFMYAASIWPRYLSEKYGNQIIQDIWNQCGEKTWLNSIEAMSDQLVARGSSLAEALGEFRTWCFFTGSRYCQFGFSEGEQYPEFDSEPFVTNLEATALVDSLTLLEIRPNYLGAAYFLLEMPRVQDTVVRVDFTITPHESENWPGGAAVAVGISACKTPDTLYSITHTTETLSIPDWKNYQQALVIAMPFSESYSEYKNILGQKFVFEIQLDSLDSIPPDTVLPPPPAGVSPVYPNPFYPGSGAELNILVMRENSEETEVFFYNSAGELVRGGRSEKKYYLEQGDGLEQKVFSWDGRNANKEEVASGIYICLVRLGGKEHIQKVAVINR